MNPGQPQQATPQQAADFMLNNLRQISTTAQNHDAFKEAHRTIIEALATKEANTKPKIAVLPEPEATGSE